MDICFDIKRDGVCTFVNAGMGIAPLSISWHPNLMLKLLNLKRRHFRSHIRSLRCTFLPSPALVTFTDLWSAFFINYARKENKTLSTIKKRLIQDNRTLIFCGSTIIIIAASSFSLISYLFIINISEDRLMEWKGRIEMLDKPIFYWQVCEVLVVFCIVLCILCSFMCFCMQKGKVSSDIDCVGNSSSKVVKVRQEEELHDDFYDKMSINV